MSNVVPFNAAGERRRVIEPNEIAAVPFTHEALALQFADENAHQFRFVALWNKWYVFDGRRWCEDATLKVNDTVRALCRRVASTASVKQRRSLGQYGTLDGAIRLARSDRRLAATVDQWDSNPWLLNTPECVIDLRTMQSRPHRPEDHLTKMTTASPDGDCPLWLSFLAKVTGGDDGLIGYLQRVTGYALTGETREHAMFFLFGHGANGKSVFLNTISGIMGDYHQTAAIETFTTTTGDQHPTGLAALRGARLVTAIETEEGRQWAESRIKSLTGGDPVSARFLYQDFFTFTPQFKLAVAGNHKPGLRSVDEAMRRRLNLIPFGITIPSAERDEHLFEKLKEEWSGILAWMLEGCRMWQEGGLNRPEAVTEATEAYLANEDAIGAWIDDCCEREVGSWEASSKLFASWVEWAGRAGEQAGTKKKLGQALEGYGFGPAKKSTGAAKGVRGFEGIRLKPSLGGYGDD